MNVFFKKAAEMADGVFDLVSMMSSRMEGKRDLARNTDLIGTNGEISVTIRKGSIGEVVVEFGGMRLNYSARAVASDAEYHKGTMVKIISTAGSVLYVEKVSEGRPSNQPSFTSLDNKPKKEEVADVEAVFDGSDEAAAEEFEDEDSAEGSETSEKKKGSSKNKKK